MWCFTLSAPWHIQIIKTCTATKFSAKNISLLYTMTSLHKQTGCGAWRSSTSLTEKGTLVKSSKRTDEIEPEESAEARGPHEHKHRHKEARDRDTRSQTGEKNCESLLRIVKRPTFQSDRTCLSTGKDELYKRSNSFHGKFNNNHFTFQGMISFPPILNWVPRMNRRSRQQINSSYKRNDTCCVGNKYREKRHDESVKHYCTKDDENLQSV